MNSASHPKDDTICAIATPPGTGAIALIRLSGNNSLALVFQIFTPINKNLNSNNIKSHSIHFGKIMDENQMIDEVLISYFKSPASYTGEDVVELSCHGSEFIQQKIIELLINKGARMANPGEFTLRAFMNGKMDLSQAEAVADLISSQSNMAHKIAISQMRGGYSDTIKRLRNQLINFAALMELELDFSEEDVEFADRKQFSLLVNELRTELIILIESFSMGNVLKKGIPVAIIGKPNVGKSTLLNAILKEEKAIVSEIPGTTRDFIEDTIIIDGFAFRFIDTAGLRLSTDEIENIGISRTYEKIEQASLILYVYDINEMREKEINEVLKEFRHYIEDKNKHFILVANKIDQLDEKPAHMKEILELDTIFVSARRNENIHLLAKTLVSKVKEKSISNNIMVSNARHYDALQNSLKALNVVAEGLDNSISTDLLAIDIKQALHYLGTISGEITNEEILGTIFSKFCIGK